MGIFMTNSRGQCCGDRYAGCGIELLFDKCEVAGARCNKVRVDLCPLAVGKGRIRGKTRSDLFTLETLAKLAQAT